MEKTWKNGLICLMGGILFHYLFYGKALGISYPLYILYIYLVFYFRVPSNGNREKIVDFLLLGSAVMLSLTFVLFNNGILLFLNFLMVPALIFIHMVHARRWNFDQWGNRLFIKSMVFTFFETILKFFNLFQFFANISKRNMNDQSFQMAKKIMIGIFISIPLLWTILYLLISSDQHFEQLLGQLPNWFYDANIGSLVFQLVLVLVITLWLFAFFITLSKPLVIPGQVEETQPVKMDIVIVSTVLLLLNFVYFLYSAVQFTYFFTGDPSSTSLSYTYAEYARRGFNELTLVSIINLGILFVLTHIGKFPKQVLPKMIKLLLSMIVIFTFVMLGSAYYRLSLYEQAYGYTYSRLYAHAFMILLVVLLALAMFKVFKEKFKLLRAMFIVSLLAYVLVNYLNMDQLIVKQNMARYAETGKLDVSYLQSLSYDAILTLIKSDNELFKEILKNKKVELMDDNENWQSYNFSRSKARKLLEKWEKVN
ncbi:DUF4153 domain-containing protein [Metabacillus litoralis]|uniref:DUF4153 domain-containing protein n=1 Tax=Metabacillus litoralis TaxID=152268 RepID=UPI001CFD0E00|nr:DUF4173 domain-containing protein [Metabacillus litoralis]